MRDASAMEKRQKISQIGDGDARTEGGEKIKVLNGACMAEINDNLRVLSGKVEVRKWSCCEILDVVKEFLEESWWMKRILPERWDIS